MRSVLLLYSFLLVLPQGRAAEMEWERQGTEASVGIFIEGPIVVGDEERFRQLLLRLIHEGLPVGHVTIYSPGGSVGAAMHIGRQIRTLRLSTAAPVHWRVQMGQGVVERKEVFCVRRSYDRKGNILPAGAQQHWARNLGYKHANYKNDSRCICTSACFLIWAAGTGRSGDWIGVHRPIFDPIEYGKLNPREAEQKYSAMVEQVKAYLVEMDIPDSIIRKMMASNSEDMHFLRTDEAKSLDNEAALEELAIAKCGGSKQFMADWNAAQGNNRRLQELLKQQRAQMACSERVYIEARRDRSAVYLQHFGGH